MFFSPFAFSLSSIILWKVFPMWPATLLNHTLTLKHGKCIVVIENKSWPSVSVVLHLGTLGCEILDSQLFALCCFRFSSHKFIIFYQELPSMSLDQQPLAICSCMFMVWTCFHDFMYYFMKLWWTPLWVCCFLCFHL